MTVAPPPASEPPARTPRPAHLRPRLVALVVLGGAAGATLRDRIEAAAATPAGAFPWATFAINVSGAFALGALIETLAFLISDAARRRAVQLSLGTGLLGGYTTYSSFAVETVGLAERGAPLLALGYAAASVAVGFAAALAAVVGVRRLGRALARPAGVAR